MNLEGIAWLISKSKNKIKALDSLVKKLFRRKICRYINKIIKVWLKVRINLSNNLLELHSHRVHYQRKLLIVKDMLLKISFSWVCSIMLEILIFLTKRWACLLIDHNWIPHRIYQNHNQESTVKIVRLCNPVEN